MRIGYDAKRAAHNFTGLGNYSRYVIEGIAKNGHNDIFLYTPRKGDNHEYQSLFTYGMVTERIPETIVGKKISSFWRSFSIVKTLKKDKINLFHGLSNELPFGIRKSGAHSVVTIHDLIFRILPHCYKPIDRTIYNFKFRYACQKADKVIAISECTKRDIIKFYGINPGKIEVIYQGCNAMFRETASTEEKALVKETYRLPEKYILNVGTLEERKNFFLIVKSLSNLPDNIHLVAVGRRTPYSDIVMEYARIHNLTHRIHLLHGVKYKHLPAIYQCAELFAYPSRYEGFGIPIIEAISSSLAVIAATGSCLEEAGGDGAIYVNPDNVEEFTKAAKQLLNDKEYREKIIELGKDHIKKFDEKALSEQIIKLYDNLLKN